MWAGQANALPTASAFLPLLNFSLHAESITVVRMSASILFAADFQEW
jgi:hypothetical protein